MENYFRFGRCCATGKARRVELGLKPIPLRLHCSISRRNYLPIGVTDACGSKISELKERSLSTLKDTGEIMRFTPAEVLPAMQR